MRSLLLPGNKHDRVETLTQSAEWSQFVVNYFLGAIWATRLGVWAIKHLSQRRTYAIAASNCCCWRRPIYSSVAASPWRYDVTGSGLLLSCGRWGAIFRKGIPAYPTQTQFLFIGNSIQSSYYKAEFTVSFTYTFTYWLDQYDAEPFKRQQFGASGV